MAQVNAGLLAEQQPQVTPKAGKRRSKKGSRRAGKAKPVRSERQALPWTFPKSSLEQAINLVKEVDEKYAGKPTKAEDVVKLAGFNRVSDWRFQDLLRSSSQYGLSTGTGETATVALTPLAADIVAPSSASQRQKALLEAFQNVEPFRRVSEYYAGKRIPEDEYFSNTLTREFNIPKDRVETFIKVFTENLNYLKAFAADKQLKLSDAQALSDPTRSGVAASTRDGHDSTATRQFLDTCFVLMPFGDWFDRYYDEIYAPAIKDAGFEPVRADGIFTTGSVIEQIWEQVSKAKVMMAELTLKNPNVFYELGLCHAIPKPVVLVSGDLEDVPFDLRHLRTVLYDVREPGWAAKLQRDITAHLKSAKTDPGKSIPQPFRDFKNGGA